MNTERIILRNTEKINEDGTIELIQQETDVFHLHSRIEIKNVTTSDKSAEHLKIYYFTKEGKIEQDWLQFRKSIANGFKSIPIEIIPQPNWTSFKIAMIDSKREQENFEISFDLVSNMVLQVV
jgi:hypothetical protein